MVLKTWRRRLGQAMIACACACLTTAAIAQTGASRSLTVDDIVRLESFGQATLSPDGRWAVFEKRDAYDSMPRVEFAGRSPWTIMQLWRVDLHAAMPAPERMLAAEGLGVQKVSWSPSGEQLLVTRLQGEVFEFGIVSMADGSVRWLGLTPDLPPDGANAVWASDRSLVLLIRPDRSLPASLRYDRDSTRLRVAAWERTALGQEPSRTVIEAHDGVLSTEATRSPSQLVRVDIQTGEKTVLVEAEIGDFALSPNGRSLAVVSREEGVPLGRPELLQLEDDRRRRLLIADLYTGSVVRPAAGLDLAPHLLRWSADSRRLLAWARGDGQRWSEGALVAASVDGVKPVDLGDLSVGDSVQIINGVKADWLGDDPVVLTREPVSDRGDWRLITSKGVKNLTASLAAPPGRIAAAESGSLYVFADDAYWRMTRYGVARLTPASVSVREAVVSDLYLARRLKGNEAPHRSWSAALGGDGESLVIDDRGRVTRIGPGTNANRAIAVSPETSLVLHRIGLSETLELRTIASERALDAVNTDLSSVTLSEPVAVSHKDVRGQMVTSWLFLPDRGEGNTIKGLIVKTYPGFSDNLVWWDPFTMTYSTRPQAFVSAGYAYLTPFIPADLSVETRGDLYVQSVDLAVDAVLEAYPLIPSDRIAIWGHSFGGYAALEIATRSTRYRSYIASSSYSDMLGVWGEFDPGARISPEDGGLFRLNQGWTEVSQGSLEAPPWKAQDLYAAASPVFRADRITAPVLFLTADMDFTPVSQAERMFSAILRNGGDAKMVTYWGEQHLLWSPANIRDYYDQILTWLDRTLSPTKPNGQADLGDAPNSASTPHRPLAPESVRSDPSRLEPPASVLRQPQPDR